MNLTGTKIVLLTIIVFVFGGCQKKEYEKHIFIPVNYEGPIRIKFGVKTSPNRVIHVGDNAFIIFITGNPLNFELYDDPCPSGYYDYHGYYYSDTLFREINMNGFNLVTKELFPILSTESSGEGYYHLWIDRDECTKTKRDSLISVAEEFWNGIR